MEKYYPNHPKIIYFTDGIINPFYTTIPIEMSLDKWTRGFREFLNYIHDEYVLLMIDDCFIRQPVDIRRIEEALSIIQSEPNVACMNFEKSWDERDLPTEHDGWKVRQHGSEYEVSLMCGLWSKEKLIDVIDRDCSPWEIELKQDGKGFDYYINSADYIIDWGYKPFKPCGVVKGKWTRECMDFLKSEGLEVDYSKKGFYL
jgi:hypothetical protein